MFKFSEVTYHPAAAAADGSVGTVDVGSGLVWDDVYAALQPHGVTVVGGRVTGVGVGGFTLGGGYSWLSNQYGLTIDTVTEFEVVLPNGTITAASEGLNPDLFFGLKGGFNNFGIVTKFTLLAFPQGQVWGGLKTFTFDQLDKCHRPQGRHNHHIQLFTRSTRSLSLNVLRWADAACGLTSLVQASPANATYGNRFVTRCLQYCVAEDLLACFDRTSSKSDNILGIKTFTERCKLHILRC
ncbi:FAD-binding domain protein [Ceratobasidium sp. AG-Ba]|nr:FAD-binding domain protein [Ceratobasidium sp. AG-Ba]